MYVVDQSILESEEVGGRAPRSDRSPDFKSIIQFLIKRSLTIMQHTNKWITLVFLSFLCTAQAALDTRTNPPAKKTPPAPARPLAPEADPTKPNRLQYHQHLMGTQTIGSTEHEHICEIGFAYPTGLKVGDTLIIKGRTDLKTGTEESTTFFNRASGHKVRETVAALLYNLFCSLLAAFIGSVLPTFVTWHIIHILICIVNPGCVLFCCCFPKVLFVDDYKHNDDGNGGRVWIEGHPTTAEHRVGGTKNEHTFDGAYGSRK
jgi:hypothetical protein